MEINETISKDPLLNLDRKAKVLKFEWDTRSEEIKLSTVVSFYKAGVLIEDKRTPPYAIELIAVNSTLVNPSTGGTVEDGELEEDCTMGEYNYLVAVANNNINIFDIMRATIAKSDARKRFDI